MLKIIFCHIKIPFFRWQKIIKKFWKSFFTSFLCLKNAMPTGVDNKGSFFDLSRLRSLSSFEDVVPLRNKKWKNGFTFKYNLYLSNLTYYEIEISFIIWSTVIISKSVIFLLKHSSYFKLRQCTKIFIIMNFGEKFLNSSTNSIEKFSSPRGWNKFRKILLTLYSKDSFELICFINLIT